MKSYPRSFINYGISINFNQHNKILNKHNKKKLLYNIYSNSSKSLNSKLTGSETFSYELNVVIQTKTGVNPRIHEAKK